MRIDVFTIFPDVVAGYCGASILGRAADAGALDVRVHDLREGADDPRRSVDDSPFGGGAGMVLDGRAGLPLRRGRPRPAPSALPARTGRAALRPGGGGRAGGGARWVLPALRPLRGGGPAGGRSPGGRRAVGGRLRAGGRGAGRPRGGGGGGPAAARGARQRAVATRRELHRRAARVPPVHPPGRVQGVGRARGAALGRPRRRGRLAPHAGPAADGRAPPRPDRAPGQGVGAQRQRRAGPG